MLPVPLNSSKMTSSMREPVSTSAVAMMVSEPPSSMLRAAPKNFLGGYSARAVDAAGEDAAAGRGVEVEGARHTRDGVEQHHDVAAHLDQALDTVEHQFGDLHVVLARLVERAGDHGADDRTLHVGDFLRALVDEQHEEVHLGVVGGDRVGELLEDGGLAGLGRRGDEAALALADGAQQVHDARRRVVLVGLEAQTLLGEQRRELLEHGALARGVRVHAVDAVDLEQCVVLLVVLGLADLAGDLVAAAQAEAADLAEADVDVAVALGEAARAQEPEAVRENVQDAGARDGGTVVAHLLAAALALAALALAALALLVAPATVLLALALALLLAAALLTAALLAVALLAVALLLGLLLAVAVAGGPVGGRLGRRDGSCARGGRAGGRCLRRRSGGRLGGHRGSGLGGRRRSLGRLGGALLGGRLLRRLVRPRPAWTATGFSAAGASAGFAAAFLALGLGAGFAAGTSATAVSTAGSLGMVIWSVCSSVLMGSRDSWHLAWQRGCAVTQGRCRTSKWQVIGRRSPCGLRCRVCHTAQEIPSNL